MEVVNTVERETPPPAPPAPKNRIYSNALILMALMAVCSIGVYITERIRPESGPELEAKMRAKVPMNVGEWRGEPDRNMGEDVYRILRPDGIVWRTYRDKQGTFLDFVMLTANHSGAFHDPTVCFTNQGQEIVEDKTSTIRVESLNQDIPVRLLRVRDTNQGVFMTAVYWWRSPGGRNLNQPANMQISSYFQKLMGMKGAPGFFYRIIVLETNDRERDKQLIAKFTSDMFGELNKTYPETIGR